MQKKWYKYITISHIMYAVPAFVVDASPMITVKDDMITYRDLTELVEENTSFGGNTLYIDPTPNSKNSANQYFNSAYVTIINRFVINRAGRCECCEAKTKLYVHIRWSYNYHYRTRRAERLMALCWLCKAVSDGDPMCSNVYNHFLKTKSEWTFLGREKVIEKIRALRAERKAVNWKDDLTLFIANKIPVDS